ncbi:unnamed protein product [Pedinophyceae sp. YPF-701]|nr:unnamed protein product [Pedinophyceae sp. YPF-701]
MHRSGPLRALRAPRGVSRVLLLVLVLVFCVLLAGQGCDAATEKSRKKGKKRSAGGKAKGSKSGQEHAKRSAKRAAEEAFKKAKGRTAREKMGNLNSNFAQDATDRITNDLGEKWSKKLSGGDMSFDEMMHLRRVVDQMGRYNSDPEYRKQIDDRMEDDEEFAKAYWGPLYDDVRGVGEGLGDAFTGAINEMYEDVNEDMEETRRRTEEMVREAEREEARKKAERALGGGEGELTEEQRAELDEVRAVEDDAKLQDAYEQMRREERERTEGAAAHSADEFGHDEF